MKSLRILATFSVALVMATLSFGQSKVVLGKLGQTTSATRIYAAPTSRARIYYRAKPFEYLVLRPSQSGGWYRVMLQNGTDGYVASEKVTELPYQVTSGTSRRSAHLAGAGVPASRSGSAIANYSLQFQGTPYKWGGTDVNRGIDCSGFVQNMFGRIGLNLPRTAAEQAMVGMPIKRLEDLQAGDRLYFWSSKRGKIGHTGIYLGNGYFINASSGQGKVTTSFLGTRYWLSTLVAARR